MYSMLEYFVCLLSLIFSLSIIVYVILSYIISITEDRQKIASDFSKLIMSHKIKFSAIPNRYKRDVANIIISVKLEHLIDEEKYKPKAWRY